MNPSDRSLRERFSHLSEEEQIAYLSKQEPWILEEMARGEWWWTARPHQVPPEDSMAFIYLALAGRGWGKSRAGAEWLVKRIQKHPYDSHGVPTEWLVIAETLGDARAICLEGPSGILRSLFRQKIIHKYIRSPRPMIVFPDGQKIYCEGADDEDVGRGYNAAGAWLDELCVAKGELILTRRGQIPVEEVAVGDEVQTRVGWRRVASAGLTKRDAEVVRIDTTAGSVRLTAEHRVWIEGLGWTQARDIPLRSTMRSWKTQSPQTPPPIWSGTARPGITTSERAITTTAPGRFSTAPSGSGLTGQSRRATRFTMPTACATITGWPTSNSSPFRSIVGVPTPNVMTSRNRRQDPHVSAMTDSYACGLIDSRVTLLAMSAGSFTNPRECAPNIAPLLAELQTHDEKMLSSVLRVVPDGRSDVYDLSVEGQPEFFAGSGQLLVHNCKWKNAYGSWYEGIMPSMRADLVGDHPKVFVTTTPKPDKLIIEWNGRNDGTIFKMSGSTFDNANNLSAVALAEMKAKYEGTNLGLQELYGELLEAMDGALFRRSDMDAGRIWTMPEDIVATAVGVDPALTDEGDEMGVVVMGRTRGNHLVCMSDDSIRAVGRDAAKHCWRTMALWNADCVVLEQNLGKNWMEEVFREAYYELVGAGELPERTTPPLVKVDARLGKRTRAEPVAMRSQQGKIHMLGRWELLEDQLTMFTGWDGKESPDRLDAFVHAARHLMNGEKKTARVFSPLQYMPTFDEWGM